MAGVAKNYLDLTGLEAYDRLIKVWANSENQKGYKTILKSADGNTLNLYKKADAVTTDEPDATVSLGGGDMQDQLDALASIAGATWVPAAGNVDGHYTIDLDNTFAQATVDIVDALNELKSQINTLNGTDSTNGSVAKSIKDAINALDTQTDVGIASVSNNVVTIKGSVSETDGIIGEGSATDVVLEEVAYTGAATDVSFAPSASSTLESTNVNAAILELEGDLKNAVEGLDVNEFALASVSNNVVNIKGIKEVDGKIAVGDGAGINLEEVAYTGAAEDVSNTAINGVTKDVSGTPVATTNVQDTLEALKNLIDSSDSDATLYAIETAGAIGSDTLKSYELIQGGTATVDQETGKVTAVTGGTTVTTINIPKDYLVKNAEVKTVTAADKAAGGIFENDSNFAVGDKYIDFTINTADGTGTGTTKHIYINVDDLMSALSVEANASEVQLALSNTNQLSASIVDIAASKITYIAADSSANPAVARESVGAALARIDGSDSTDGSIKKAVKDAVAALDTVNNVAIATASGETITLTGAINEVDGIVGGISTDNITISPIATADIDALFA